MRESSEYSETMRRALIHLITECRIQELNAFEFAIELGASDFLKEICKTIHVVSRIDDDQTLYDVTNMTSDALLSDDVASPCPGAAPVHQPKLTKCYLERIIDNEEVWINKDILYTEPLRMLTDPLVAFTQRLYFLTGVLHLLFMVQLSRSYFPERCSLSYQFSVNLSMCSNTHELFTDIKNRSFEDVNPLHSSERRYPSVLWLIWPVGLMLYLVISLALSCSLYVRKRLNKAGYNLIYGNTSFKKILMLDSLTLTLLRKVADKFPTIGFSISFMVWFHSYKHANKSEDYLRITSLVFAFGWLVDFLLFSGITKYFNVFYLVVVEILIRDILMSFSLVFVFTIVAYSWAISVLSITLDDTENSYKRFSETVYDVFVGTAGLEPMNVTTRDAAVYLMMYSVVISSTAVILMNILIAMINNRYEVAKSNAQNVWRHTLVGVALRAQRLKICNWVNHAYFFGFIFCCCGCQSVYKKEGRYYVLK